MRVPKLSTIKLTKKVVDALPTDKDQVFFDSEIKGFGVRTKATGSKTYIVQYKTKDRKRSGRVTIGGHGAGWTPETARDKARIILTEVARGNDPAQDITEARKAATVAEFCAQYLEGAEKGLVLDRLKRRKKPSTLASDRGRILHHIIPHLGQIRVRDLTRADIEKFVEAVKSGGKPAKGAVAKPRGRLRVTGGPGAATRTHGLLSGILTYAVKKGLIQTNPAHGVATDPDQKRIVRLSPEQYAALGRALEVAKAAGEPWQAVVAIRLLALTGCRRGEIVNLKWPEVDFQNQTLRLVETKTGESVRPLGAEAMALLASLSRTGPFVFHSQTEGNFATPYLGLPKAWARIIERAAPDDAALLAGLTPHGLRHAYASTSGDLGLTEITIGALIGHSVGGITSRYIHAVDTVLTGAANRVAGRIAAQMAGRDDAGQVVPLRAAQ